MTKKQILGASMLLAPIVFMVGLLLAAMVSGIGLRATIITCAVVTLFAALPVVGGKLMEGDK